MPSFAFSKLIPGGNATIILTDPDIAPGQLPDISARLMSPMHIQAEQVGALYSPGFAPVLPGVMPHLPHLQMMGGEFCVNATRSAALLLALRGGMADGIWKGQLTVSGRARPVRVLASQNADCLEAALRCPGRDAPGGSPESTGENVFPLSSSPSPRMASDRLVSDLAGGTVHSLHCAACVDCAAPGTGRRVMQPGVTLVSMPGIQHLLVDLSRHPLPDLHSAAWKNASAAWRSACGLADAPASGVVWYEQRGDGYRIWPAVEVLATGSEHLESACGSGSLAMALMHRSLGREAGNNDAGADAVKVIQPSGETLYILFPSASPESAWIAGHVRLAARGVAHVCD